MATDFLRNLADIAPTWIIPGNHDGNLKNSNRQDAITPIVDALQHPNLHLLKDSGETSIDDKFSFNVLSVFDRENWVKPTDTERINIALYHGSISGCRTDVGWRMQHGEDELTIFNDHDYAMLGDIHKCQAMDDYKRVWYAGSTIQQNHGETNDKGFLIWEIEDKISFEVRHVELKNPKPFVTIELTPKGRLPRGTNIQPNARLRLVSNNNLSLNKMRRAVDIAKHRFKPESITFLNRALGNKQDSNAFLHNAFVKENLRDVSVQKKLIRDFLKDYEVDDEATDRIFQLNSKYNQTIEENEEVARNINWKLESFEWDNLFNYGEDNKIDFNSLSGIVGIFGKNYSGKSSVIDGLLYTIFNSTSKNERKNLNIINQNKEIGSGKATISVGDSLYEIDRVSEKYTKKLKGEVTMEAKTDLEFTSCDSVTQEVHSQNGLTRLETDKNIRKMFGTLDDFLLTSMASQLDSLSFIKEGSTKRKEILAKFLDLELFDKKFKLAKEDAQDLRGALKRLEGREFDEEIAEAEVQLADCEKEIVEHKTACREFEIALEVQEAARGECEDKINSIPTEIIDIAKITEEFRKKKNQIFSLKSQIEQSRAARKIQKELYSKICEFIDSYDIDELNKKREKIKKLNMLVEELDPKRDVEKQEKLRNIAKSKLLDDIPCGDSFPTCRFIKDAHVAIANIPINEERINSIEQKQLLFKEEVSILDPKKAETEYQKYNSVLERKTELSVQIADLDLSIERNKLALGRAKIEIEELQLKIDNYEENKEAIENLEILLKEQRSSKKEVARLTNLIQKCDEQLKDLYIAQGSSTQLLENVQAQKEELNNLREEYSAYDLFMKCMHSSGISYDIIKRKLPVINEEIAKVVSNIVNFEVFFEDDGSRLNIFIKHPKHEPRPLEMASGAEKTIAAMAIRLALLSVSNLPKSNVFILDEPGTALDAENLEGFVRILDMVKSYFKVVILISHLDSLKDCADMIINIEKKDGYAHVSC